MTDKPKSFPSGWYVNTSKQDTREEIKNTVLRARPTLDMLKVIVERKLTIRTEVSPDDYDCPSWPYKAADQAGYRRAMLEILSLVDIEGVDA